MSGTRDIRSMLDEYGESHQHGTNELIHWICVPTIFFCMIGFIASIPAPKMPYVGVQLWSYIAIALVWLFYAQRSLTLMIGMGAWCAFCLAVAIWIEHHAPWPLWAVCAVLLTLAWIGQFIGHYIEGKKPSFLKDLQFLLIGPAWLMSKIYRRLGIPV